MIVPQPEIDTILGLAKRRSIRLPAVRTERQPVARGQVCRLQTALFAPAQATITVLDCRKERLDELKPADAKREGVFGGVENALRHWELAHGKPERDQMVWAISFAVGDHSGFMQQDEPLYLAKIGGDYTTVASRQAVPGDPPVCVIPGAGEQARVMAIARRQGPQEGSIKRAREGLGELRASIAEMKDRLGVFESAVRLSVVEGQLDAIVDELPIQGVVRCQS